MDIYNDEKRAEQDAKREMHDSGLFDNFDDETGENEFWELDKFLNDKEMNDE